MLDPTKYSQNSSPLQLFVFFLVPTDGHCQSRLARQSSVTGSVPHIQQGEVRFAKCSPQRMSCLSLSDEKNHYHLYLLFTDVAFTSHMSYFVEYCNAGKGCVLVSLFITNCCRLKPTQIQQSLSFFSKKK